MKKNKMYTELKRIVADKVKNALYCYAEYDADYDYLVQMLDEIINKKMAAINESKFSIKFEYGYRNTRITLMTDNVIGTCVFTNNEYDMLLRRLERLNKDFQKEIREIRKEKHRAFKQQSKSNNKCCVVSSR